MIEDQLRSHDGVITIEQAVRCGMTKHSVQRRVRSGQWRWCSRGVYFADDRPFTDAARVRAAVWGYGARATASGLAAAWWLGLTKYPPAVVEVTVPRVSNHPRRPNVRLRRRDLHEADIVEVRGLQVTALPLTVIEAAVRQRGGMKIIDDAVGRTTNLAALWRAHLRNKGRHGSPAARRLLRAADGGTKSEAERIFKRLLNESGITGWTANQRLAGYEVDFLFRDAKLAVEIDGLAFHSDADVFQRDRVKQNAISLAGFQVLRFTWLDLIEYPDRVIAEVKRAIRAR